MAIESDVGASVRIMLSLISGHAKGSDPCESGGGKRRRH